MTTPLFATGTGLSGARTGAPGPGMHSIPEELVVPGAWVVPPEGSHEESVRFRHGKEKNYGNG